MVMGKNISLGESNENVADYQKAHSKQPTSAWEFSRENAVIVC